MSDNSYNVIISQRPQRHPQIVCFVRLTVQNPEILELNSHILGAGNRESLAFELTQTINQLTQ